MATLQDRNVTLRRRTRHLPFALFVCIVVAAGGCSFQSFDYLKKGGATTTAKGGKSSTKPDGGEAGDSGGNSGELGGVDGGGMTGTGGAAGAGIDASGAGGSAGAAGDAASAGVAGASTTTPPSPMIGPWNFDTAADMSDWVVKIPSIVAASWVTQGETEPLGAMALTVSAVKDPAEGVVQTEVEYAVPLAKRDLSTRKIFFRVRAETVGLIVKIYCMGDGWAWADGGQVTIGPSWTTVGMSFAQPSFAGTGELGDYSPNSILVVGIQPSVNADPELDTKTTIWVDRIWME